MEILTGNKLKKKTKQEGAFDEIGFRFFCFPRKIEVRRKDCKVEGVVRARRFKMKVLNFYPTVLVMFEILQSSLLRVRSG